jgi:hypothetical protein
MRDQDGIDTVDLETFRVCGVALDPRVHDDDLPRGEAELESAVSQPGDAHIPIVKDRDGPRMNTNVTRAMGAWSHLCEGKMSLKNRTRTGWGLSALVALALTMSAAGKIAGVPKMVDGLVKAGIPREAIVPIAILELTCLALYLVRRSTVVGTLLLTGFFGGATLTHLIAHESLIPPLLIGMMIWAGAYFRMGGEHVEA